MDKQAIAVLPAQQALGQLHTSLEGLSSSEAEQRRATSGPNILTKSKHTALGILVRQLKSSLIYLLAFASLFSFVLGDLSDGIIIAIILVINTSLGFVQEYRAERAVEKLSSFIRKKVVVKRLSSLEDLGNITLLCTDKTGTLTEGKMRIQKIVAEDPLRWQLFAAASVESTGEKGALQSNSYDAAFLAYISPEMQEQAREYRQVQAFPFDPERRRRCVVLEASSTHTRYLVVLGAVETLLALSDGQDQQKEQYLAEGAARPGPGLSRATCLQAH